MITQVTFDLALNQSNLKMAPEQPAVKDPKKKDSEIFDNHRSAHRVFRVRKGADLFNPFRHIPWVSGKPKDVEATGQHGLRVDQSKYRKVISQTTV
jgi:hypothetical protein